MRSFPGIRFAAVLALTASLVGCYSAPVIPPVGMFYSNIGAPISTGPRDTAMPQSEGLASSSSVLGLFAWGDASVEAAAAQGNLKTVDHLDYDYFNVLGIYQVFTTRAYGSR